MISVQLPLEKLVAYVDENFNEIKPTLTSLTRRMKTVEEVTKNWSHMQEDLKSLNQEMVAVWESQMVVHGLMEGIS